MKRRAVLAGLWMNHPVVFPGKRFVIDLSEAAAERPGFRRKGVAQVALHLKSRSRCLLSPTVFLI